MTEAMNKQELRLMRNDQILIAPSLLAADFACLQDELAAIEAGGADILHVDIMDGHFVPNLSMGPGVVKSIRDQCKLPFDVHLMLSHPADYVEPFAEAGADHITFHIECENDIDATIDHIRSTGCSVGLSLRPGTSVETLFPYLEAIDLVLVMTVEPGFGGQSFMGDMMPKVRALRDKIEQDNLSFHVEVDGGVTSETASTCVAAGANMLVAGTSIFRAPEGAAQAIADLRI